MFKEVKEFDENVLFEIGRRIQEVRLAKRITGIDLAVELGIGRNQLSRIETGRAKCTLPQLFVLGQVLECSIDFLLYGEKAMSYSQEQEESIKNLIAAFAK